MSLMFLLLGGMTNFMRCRWTTSRSLWIKYLFASIWRWNTLWFLSNWNFTACANFWRLSLSLHVSVLSLAVPSEIVSFRQFVRTKSKLNFCRSYFCHWACLKFKLVPNGFSVVISERLVRFGEREFNDARESFDIAVWVFIFLFSFTFFLIFHFCKAVESVNALLK